MAFNGARKCCFHTQIFKNLPTIGGGNRTLPPLASPPRFGSLLTNPGCTTVTGIAKGTGTHAPPPPPLIGINN